MSVSFEKRAVIPSDVLVSELGGEAVLLNLKTESYFGLDEVGARMWSVVTTADSVQSACDALVEEYEVEPARLEDDLNQLLSELVDNGLLELQ